MPLIAPAELLVQQVLPDSAARTAYVLARAIDYLGTAVFLGGLTFIALLWPAGGAHRGTRRLITIGWLLGLIGTLATIGLEGAWATQRPPTDALRWDLILQVLDLPFGHVWAAKALLWALAGVVLTDLLQRPQTAARSPAWRVGAGAVGLGLLRTTDLTGHAAEPTSAIWTQLAALIHLAGISVWFGGLTVLIFGVLAKRDPGDLAAVIPRYSRLALGSVIAIITAGSVLALGLVGSLDRLLNTGYGHLLIAKLAAFGIVLIAALASKTWVSRRLNLAVARDGDAAIVRPFVYSVVAETTLLILVVLAASLLVTTSPGR